MVHELIGQKVHLDIIERKTKSGVHTIYEVNDPVMEAKIRAEFSTVRIFPPGTAGTMDIKPFRTNVYIDKDGVITNIKKG